MFYCFIVVGDRTVICITCCWHFRKRTVLQCLVIMFQSKACPCLYAITSIIKDVFSSASHV